MAVDISSKVQSLRVISSVDDSEAIGSVVLAGTDLVDDGTLAYDKQVYINVGYDDVNSLIMRGVISDIKVTDTPQGDKQTELTLMSLFKNYRKTILHTKYFPDDTPIKNVLELLAGTYMGLPAEAYDFTMFTDKMERFRIENMNLVEAMQKLAETGLFELAWCNGILKGTQATIAELTYDKERCSLIEKGQKPDINIITSINVIGREMDREGGERKIVATYNLSKDYLTAETKVWYFEVKIDELPADDFVIDDNATKFTFQYIRMRYNYAILAAIRTSDGNEPANVTVQIEARVYKNKRLEQKVISPFYPGVGEYSGDFSTEYDNPFVQSFFDAIQVGAILFQNNYSSRKPITVIAPHNSELMPNMGISIQEDGVPVYSIVARSIETTWNVNTHALEDKIMGWDITGIL